jgi:tetratricopeptide (TPR) repeat protein
VLSVQDIADGRHLAAHRMQRFDVLKELGDCYAAMGRFAQAEECYIQAARLAPEQASPFVALGIVAVQQERLGEAEIAFLTAARRDERCAEAYGGLAMVRQRGGDYAGAFDMHLRCLELDNDNLVALLGLFQTSCQMGTFAKVIHFLEVYLQRHPGDVSVLFCLAALYAREGRLQHARQSLLGVLALAPDKPEAEDLLRQVEEQLAEPQTQGAVTA